MSGKQWQPEELSRLAHGYWASCALQAGVQTGLTAALCDGPAAPAALAERLGLNTRGAAMLCTALHALGLLQRRRDGAYALAPGLQALLDPASPRSLVNMVLHMADMVGDWSRLAECVASGKGVEELGPPPEDKEGRAHFYRAMRDIARGQAPGLAARLGLTGGQSLLDLGGGPGVYALTFADEVPGLKAAVFDLPGSRRFFQEEAARHRGAERVRFLAGDYEDGELGGPYDVVWISQVLHGEGPAACQALIDKAAGALKPGGVLWVQEFVLDPVQPEHPWPALFALNMLINTPAGQSYTAAEISGFMERAGLVEAHYAGPTKPGGPSGLVRGSKPRK